MQSTFPKSSLSYCDMKVEDLLVEPLLYSYGKGENNPLKGLECFDKHGRETKSKLDDYATSHKITFSKLFLSNFERKMRFSYCARNSISW